MDKNHYMFGLSEEQAKNCKKCAIIENQSVPRSRKDSHDISEELMNAFINPGGAFYEFYKFSKDHRAGNLFQGKGNPECIINHIVWQLYATRSYQKFTVVISYDHARYLLHTDRQNLLAD